MQSGITVSQELQTAFNDFLSDTALFALPVTITSESLVPLPSIPFVDSFEQSLPQLERHCDPKTPCYIIVRRSAGGGRSRGGVAEDGGGGGGGGGGLVIITYIPSAAPVRAKTLFASTRTTVVRELGRERFEGKGGNVFVTDAREVLDVREWEEREPSMEGGLLGAGAGPGPPLTEEERELRGVKRAEDEERHAAGTRGRDLMGSGGSGAGGNGAGGAEGKTNSLKMKMEDEARKALAEMGERVGSQGTGRVVQLGIHLATETLTLSLSSSDISPAALSSRIPSNTPSYTFYQPPATTSAIFIYCCPGSSKIKERMLYASSRANVVSVAQDEGVQVARRVEIGAPDEIGEQRLEEEMAPPAAGDEAGSVARPGFARPKRPGRR